MDILQAYKDIFSRYVWVLEKSGSQREAIIWCEECKRTLKGILVLLYEVDLITKEEREKEIEHIEKTFDNVRSYDGYIKETIRYIKKTTKKKEEE